MNPGSPAQARKHPTPAPTQPPPDLTDYTQLARLGRTSRPRYVAGFATIIGFWVVLGFVVTLLLLRLLPGAAQQGQPSLGGYLASNASLLTLLLGVLIAVRFIHHRPIRSLITAAPRIDWRRLARSFLLFSVLVAATRAVEALLYPGSYQFTLDLSRWLAMLPVLLLVTSLQAFGEELYFRGYLLQAFGLWTRRRWLLITFCTLAFAAFHVLNVALSGDWLLGSLYFLAVSAFLTVVTVRDNRLELAIGIHAANNLFVVLLVNNPNSGLPTDAIWRTSHTHPLFNLLSFCAVAAIMYGLLVRKSRLLVGTGQRQS
jgi:CAAX protease family protein